MQRAGKRLPNDTEKSFDDDVVVIRLFPVNESIVPQQCYTAEPKRAENLIKRGHFSRRNKWHPINTQVAISDDVVVEIASLCSAVSLNNVHPKDYYLCLVVLNMQQIYVGKSQTLIGK